MQARDSISCEPAHAGEGPSDDQLAIRLQGRGENRTIRPKARVKTQVGRAICPQKGDAIAGHASAGTEFTSDDIAAVWKANQSVHTAIYCRAKTVVVCAIG